MPDRITLTRKPLVEAIFELQWELPSQDGGVSMDPHYKLLVGQIYEKVKNKYAFHESLPMAAIPAEITGGGMVQHRFRVAENGWPLIQVGPGVITLNDTENYSWKDFRTRILFLLRHFFQAHPQPEELRLTKLLLRYIDAIEFDYTNDVLEFLNDKMKIGVNFDKAFFVKSSIKNLPLGLDLRFAFECKKPRGALNARFARGLKRGKDALIWETMVQSSGETAQSYRNKIEDWVKQAHTATDDWFFRMIDGELREKFK